MDMTQKQQPYEINLTDLGNSILRRADGVWIPFDIANGEYVAFCAWMSPTQFPDIRDRRTPPAAE